MKKIELSEDFFPEQEQEGSTGKPSQPSAATVDRETVEIILGKAPPESRSPRRSSNSQDRRPGPAAESPLVLVATLPFVLTRNMMTLAASMLRAGLPPINLRRR